MVISSSHTLSIAPIAQHLISLSSAWRILSLPQRTHVDENCHCLQELDERYTLMLGGLLWEAPSTKLLNLLMNVSILMASVAVLPRKLS